MSPEEMMVVINRKKRQESIHDGSDLKQISEDQSQREEGEKDEVVDYISTQRHFQSESESGRQSEDTVNVIASNDGIRIDES